MAAVAFVPTASAVAFVPTGVLMGVGLLGTCRMPVVSLVRVVIFGRRSCRSFGMLRVTGMVLVTGLLLAPGLLLVTDMTLVVAVTMT